MRTESRGDKKRAFFKKHRKICEIMLDKEVTFRSGREKTLLGGLLVAFARIDIGFSDKMTTCDIFQSLHRTWHQQKKKQRSTV